MVYINYIKVHEYTFRIHGSKQLGIEETIVKISKKNNLFFSFDYYPSSRKIY